MNNIAFIIPARKGSKGLPGKNHKLLLNKPLIQHTIDLIKELELVKNLIVSTDDEFIISLCNEESIQIHQRSENLAQDDTLIVDVLIDISERFQFNNIGIEWIILLEPTTPLRKKERIEEALNLIKYRDELDTILCYTEEEAVFWYENRSGQMSREKIKSTQRQQRSLKYKENGVLYAFKTKNLSNRKLIGNDVYLLKVTKKESFDINDIEDWLIVESIIKNHE